MGDCKYATITAGPIFFPDITFTTIVVVMNYSVAFIEIIEIYRIIFFIFVLLISFFMLFLDNQLCLYHTIGIAGKNFWAKQLRKKKLIKIEEMDIIVQLREDVLTGKCRLSDNDADLKAASSESKLQSSRTRKVGKVNSSLTMSRENSEKITIQSPGTPVPSEMGQSAGVLMKVEKAKLIFKKGSKRRQQVDVEVVPATFVSDRRGSKRDSVENDKFSEENTVLRKGDKNSTFDINSPEGASIKRRASLHKLDRKLESSIAAGTLKPSLKYQNSDADLLNDMKDNDLSRASFMSGFMSNDKKSAMVSNTIKNSLKSDFVTPVGILSKAKPKGKDGKIVASTPRMTVKFDLPDYVENEEYRPDEDFKTEVHFS